MIRYLLITIALITVVFIVIGDYLTIVEFYGCGPPYYGRTTNMDKWTNPLPRLIVINTVGVAIVFILMRFTKKDIKK